MSDTAVAAPSSARRLKGSMIELLVVVLIGGAIGAAFEATRPSLASAGKPADAPVAGPPPEPSTLYDLPPIVTNLGAPQDTWIRLEGSIVFDPRVLPNPEAVAGKLGEDILAYLRTVSLKRLEGPIGLENIRQDLNERAATRSGGKVREFVIRTLVVQ
jgi:flagellar protein FliL